MEYIGFLAGALTTIALIPQVIKTWKLKETKDISLGMYLIFSIGVLLWLIYGLTISNIPIITANSITLALALVLIAFKIKYK